MRTSSEKSYRQILPRSLPHIQGHVAKETGEYIERAFPSLACADFA